MQEPAPAKCYQSSSGRSFGQFSQVTRLRFVQYLRLFEFLVHSVISKIFCAVTLIKSSAIKAPFKISQQTEQSTKYRPNMVRLLLIFVIRDTRGQQISSDVRYFCVFEGRCKKWHLRIALNSLQPQK